MGTIFRSVRTFHQQVEEFTLDVRELRSPDDYEGDLSTFHAIVAGRSVVASLPDDGVELARLLTRIETRRLRPLPLPAAALAHVQIDIPEASERAIEQLLALELSTTLVDVEVLEEWLGSLPSRIVLDVFRDERDGRAQLRVAGSAWR